MHELTLDPDVVVVARDYGSSPRIVYERISSGERWAVTGECNRCGLCVIGAVGDWYVWDGPAGTPNASRDLRVPNRPDDPICPGFIEDMQTQAAVTPTATVSGCSLAIEVL